MGLGQSPPQERSWKYDRNYEGGIDSDKNTLVNHLKYLPCASLIEATIVESSTPNRTDFI